MLANTGNRVPVVNVCLKACDSPTAGVTAFEILQTGTGSELSSADPTHVRSGKDREPGWLQEDLDMTQVLRGHTC